MPRVTITVPGKTPQPYRFQLDRQSVLLGRGSESDIAIDCESISLKHAEMRRIPGGYELCDLGSTNGIKQNDERREIVRLQSGQTLILGDVEFDFELTSDEVAELAQENQAAPEEVVPAKPSLPQLPEVEPPKPKAAAPVRSKPQQSHLGMTLLLFLILVIAAFAAGMAVRYQKDTGESWIRAILNRDKAAAPAAVSPDASAVAPDAAAPADDEFADGEASSEDATPAEDPLEADDPFGASDDAE